MPFADWFDCLRLAGDVLLEFELAVQVPCLLEDRVPNKITCRRALQMLDKEHDYKLSHTRLHKKNQRVLELNFSFKCCATT